MFESANDVLKQAFTFLIPMLITGAVTVVCSAISAAAVYYYDKSRGIKEKGTTYFLIFLFGILGVIVYYFKTKKKTEKNDSLDEGKSKKFRMISIILIVIAVIGWGANIYASQTGMYDTDEYKQSVEKYASGFYDKYGNEYDNRDEVIYYTVDGCEFKMAQENSGYPYYYQMSDTYNNKYKEEYDGFLTYIDEDGYIVFFDKELELDDNCDWNDNFCYMDSVGHHYAQPYTVIWNSDGTLQK